MLSFGLKLSHRDVACVTRTAIVCHCDHVTDEFNSKHDNKRQWQLIVSCKYKFDAGYIAKFDFNFIETTKRFPFNFKTPKDVQRLYLIYWYIFVMKPMV